MKRIHLFEIEDFTWFPSFLRNYMTRYIAALHKILSTTKTLHELISKTLAETKETEILDLCSGSGGPLKDVYRALKEEKKHENLKLTFCDLYPNLEEAKSINSSDDDNLRYLENSVDATQPNREFGGLRTMLCSFHHMTPPLAKKILRSSYDAKQSILIFEISDNGPPLLAGLISLPIVAIMTFLVTPFVRPLTFGQVFFTYIIPILPICIAWDGTVSNIRTYTLDDLDELISEMKSNEYVWEKGIIKGRTNSLFLLGKPVVCGS